jgi:hypothetical protein
MVQGLDKVNQLLTLTMAADSLTHTRTLAQLRPHRADRTARSPTCPLSVTRNRRKTAVPKPIPRNARAV